MRFTGTFIIVVVVFVAVLVTSNIVAVEPIQQLTLPLEFLEASGLMVAQGRFLAPEDRDSTIEWMERTRHF